MRLITINSFAAMATAVALSQAAAAGTVGQAPEAVNDDLSAIPYQSDYCDGWWLAFDDSALDSLIALGEQHNPDVLTAMHNIDLARAAVGSARAGWMPTVTADAGWTRAQTSDCIGSQRGGRAVTSYFSAGLSASWEIDLFGRTYDAVRGKKSQYRASRADYESAMLSLQSQIASTYFQYCAARAQLAIANEHCAEQAKIVDMTQARLDAGLATALEVAQAQIVLGSTQASIPVIDNEIRQSANALAVLCGISHEQLAELLPQQATLPDYRMMTLAEVPADMLRRRPDVRAAEMQIDACAAQIGVARKEYLPSLTINGSIGTEAHRFDRLMSAGSATYSIAPTLSWTVFDGLSRKYANESARLQMENAIEAYNSTLLTAVQEADNAINSYAAAVQHIELLTAVVEESQRALTLSVDLYRQGLTPFSNVVDAQIDLLQYQNSLIEAKQDALTALVAIAKSLGGRIQ